jgi:Tfp pilus assembly protein PilN
MSASINLLPPEMYPRNQRRHYQRQQRQPISRKRMLAIIVGVLLGGLYMAFMGHMWLQAEQLALLESELAPLEARYRQVLACEEEISFLETRTVELQKTLDGGLRRWGAIITDINEAMPPEAVLLKLEENEVRGELVIEGNSTSLEAVGIFLKNLQRNSYWQAVNLQEVKGSGTILTFTIQASFNGSETIPVKEGTPE